MVQDITNTYLTRLSLKENKDNKIKLDASRVNKKEEFFQLMGLQKNNVRHGIDFVLKKTKILPCRVVVTGVKCNTCKRSFKCKTDLDLHVKKRHVYIMDENTSDSQYHYYQVPYDFVQNTGKFQTKNDKLRVVLKIGNEVLSKVDLKRKYLEMNVCLRSENDNLSEESKWPATLQNGVQPAGTEKHTDIGIDVKVQGNDAIVTASELTVFQQELANIMRTIGERFNENSNSTMRKVDSVEAEKPKAAPSDVADIYLTDDDDILDIVEIKKANENAKITSAKSINNFANENKEPTQKEQKKYGQMRKAIAKKKLKGVLENSGTRQNSQPDILSYFQKNIGMADALEQMRKMEGKGFYVRERQAGRKQLVQTVGDTT